LAPDLAHAADRKFSSQTRRTWPRSRASRQARAEAFDGSARCAAWAW
jgi:hypothetical protein